MTAPIAAVYDCNVLLQALANPLGPAGRCVSAAIDGRVQIFLDDALLSEMRDVASRPEVCRKLRLLPARTTEFLENLERIGIFSSDVPDRFTYMRDPADAHYVNLALAENASFIVSRDRDLLDLMDVSTEEGRAFQTRFPALRIVDPVAFLRQLER